MPITIYIKNMVCVRCKMAVEKVLNELEIAYLQVHLGKVVFEAPLDADQLRKLSGGLLYYKLELMDNRKKILVEQIKSVIIDLFQSPEKELLLKFSEYLTSELHYCKYPYTADSLKLEKTINFKLLT